MMLVMLRGFTILAAHRFVLAGLTCALERFVAISFILEFTWRFYYFSCIRP